MRSLSRRAIRRGRTGDCVSRGGALRCRIRCRRVGPGESALRNALADMMRANR